MAVHFNCQCLERKKPVEQRAWIITEYKHNSSVFVKKGGEYSDWSQILCVKCGKTGRSKSKYVDSLKILSPQEAYKLLNENRKSNE